MEKRKEQQYYICYNQDGKKLFKEDIIDVREIDSYIVDRVQNSPAPIHKRIDSCYYQHRYKRCCYNLFDFNEPCHAMVNACIWICDSESFFALFVKQINQKEQQNRCKQIISKLQVVFAFEPIFCERKIGQILEQTSDDDQGDNFILFPDICCNGCWQVMDKQVNFIHQYK